MDGFVRSTGSTQPMGYWTEQHAAVRVLLRPHLHERQPMVLLGAVPDLPEPPLPDGRHGLREHLDRQRKPQDPPPPNGTIFDRLSAYGIDWRNYFTDLPQTGIIPSIIEKYPTNLAPNADFLLDCGAGTLPAVSFVDPEFGVLGEVGSALATLPGLEAIGAKLSTTGGDEEDPQDMSYGEYWAYETVKAVLDSPAWPRTLLIYTYDEHGGYYDHVAPPAAVAPDSIAPNCESGDVPGGYDIYGPRVPGIVASPYSKPNGVTNVVHDHTSVLATIEAKWNLPALTYRDANARTVEDFLDLSSPRRSWNRRARSSNRPCPTGTLAGS